MQRRAAAPNRVQRPRPTVELTSSANSTRRTTRTRDRVVTYRESSDSEEDTTSEEDSSTPRADTYTPSTTIAIPSSSTSRHRSKRSNLSNVSRQRTDVFDGHKRRKLSHRIKAQKKSVHVIPNVVISNHNPSLPWQYLPYAILVKIMKYAAYPLYNNLDLRQGGIQWLLNVSRLCKSLHDAAMTALFECPPLIPAEFARGLTELLSSDPSTLSLNYAQRVRSLQIEVRELLLRKSGFQLERLLRHTPLVRELKLYHAFDKYVGKALWADPRSTTKWSYTSLFDTLDSQYIKLEAFEWNGRSQDMITRMTEVHTMSCMQSLKDVTIFNLIFDERRESERIIARDTVVQALNLLPNLKSLTFRYCNILDDAAVSQLPPGISSLNIADCISLTSDGVKSYLNKSGSSLRHLDLVGNQVMSLGFISNLKETCPDLQTLHIDLTYDDCTSYNDREPLYDDLLPSGSPTWPRTLQSIVIGPLRALSIQDAESFYASLTTTASTLRYLRVLSFKTILTEASWRDRARLRAEWIPRFEKVFLRRDTPPSNATKSSGRKSIRLQELEDSSSYDSVDEKDAGSASSGTTSMRQNACHTVEFELSGQRPATNQFTEQDFMDEELEGDGTYTG